MERRAAPVRICVGCRSRAPTSELLRVVAVKHHAVVGLVPDPRRRRPGRGAHIHPDPTCLALAERRRAFGRALRVAGVLDTGPLRQYVSGSHDPEQPKVGQPTPDQQGRTTDMSTR